jgi:hypothetical protein
MTVTLPELPPRIKRLPKDERGFPIPRFVEWFKDGKPAADRSSPGAVPDFRYADAAFRARAFRNRLCWVCGDPTGVHRVFCVGPMCVVNRTTAEPASHRDCAEFAVKACPFLLRPRMRRLPMDEDEPGSSPGIMIERNPGCVALYETNEAVKFGDGRGGWLIRLGAPDRIDWWAEGRQATRAEIQASIDSGFPILLGEAMKDGQEAVDELTRLAHKALQLLPAA